jgi:hypothetical protein
MWHPHFHLIARAELSPRLDGLRLPDTMDPSVDAHVVLADHAAPGLDLLVEEGLQRGGIGSASRACRVSSICRRTRSSDGVSRIAAFMRATIGRATIGAGVSAGAKAPHQALACSPGKPASSAVCT